RTSCLRRWKINSQRTGQPDPAKTNGDESMTHKPDEKDAAAFTGTIDLASQRIGAKVLYANDEFFAEKENLIKPGRGIFIVDKYTDRGKWMDGWESRRKRVPGHDWCVLKLGIPGQIHGVDIDTIHFTGNNPAYASVDAAEINKDLSLAE